MRRVLAVAATVIATFLLLLVIIVEWMYWGESPNRRFGTYAEAASAGFTGPNGWLPEVVPASAREIRLAYDLDSNQRWARFEFSEIDSSRMLQGLRPISLRDAAPRRPHWRVRWWPGDLENEESAGFSFFGPASQPEYAVCLAVSWTRRLAYAWSCDPRAV